VAVGLLLIQLYRQSTEAQVGQAEVRIARACDMIGGRYGFYVAGWSNPGLRQPDERLRTDLTAVVAVALAHQEGVEGGIWQTGAGSLAYAFPTYQGSGPKTDLPAAEREEIQAVNQRAAADEQQADHRTTSRTQTLLLHACPLNGPISGLTGWTMTRVQSALGLRPLQFGFGVLLALMVAMSVWLGRTLLVWGRHVRGIESALATAGPGAMPSVPRTGERELDRIIDALNEAGVRLAKARLESDEMALRVARAERLASLGRVAAGVAHEIRNPIAAARLQGENALAGDDGRRRQAITEMLRQIDRLDAHVAELLAMTQRVDPHPVRVDLATFLAGQADRHKETAAAKRVTVAIRTIEGFAWLDPAVIGRVLDNLLTNAIRHTPAGGAVTLAAERAPSIAHQRSAIPGTSSEVADSRGNRDRSATHASPRSDTSQLVLTVEDTGPGVPTGMLDHLFEPFVTGRADGTGLGLAIARELADAHGGRLALRQPSAGSGAVFALVLPQENAWHES
jgi:hypothetical protein